MENVSNLLSADMREVMEYIIEDFDLKQKHHFPSHYLNSIQIPWIGRKLPEGGSNWLMQQSMEEKLEHPLRP